MPFAVVTIGISQHGMTQAPVAPKVLLGARLAREMPFVQLLAPLSKCERIHAG
jgi:hypothetical protein